MKFVISSRARRDLHDIGEWISRDSADAALRFLAELEDKARAIVEAPLAYPFAPELRHLELRKRSVRGYLIIYRYSRSTVRIVRVVSGKRDYARLFR